MPSDGAARREGGQPGRPPVAVVGAQLFEYQRKLMIGTARALLPENPAPAGIKESAGE